jgi:two-component system CheB/CheR fusion protein
MRLPVGVVCVNSQYDIQTINNTARRQLGIHGTALDEDFIHLAQSLPSREVRAAIDNAIRGEPSTIRDIEVTDSSTANVRYLDITIAPESSVEPGDRGGAAVIIVTDVTERMLERTTMLRSVEEHARERDALEEKVADLLEINRDLLAANQELTVTNMELRSANEEFLVGNEELQAAAEEVETLNEELQATNEELETLNEELQATVEELHTTNDDLQARSIELQELAVEQEAQRVASEQERARLHAILEGMAEAVLVVDEEGRPLLTNNAYDAMLSTLGPGADRAVDDGEGNPLQQSELPAARVARGESFAMTFSVADGESRRWFDVTGRPVRLDDVARGGVIVVREITDRGMAGPSPDS